MLLKATTKARRAFKRRFFNSSSRLVRSAVALSAAVTVFSLAPASAAGQAAPGQAGGCPNDSAHFHPCAMAKAKAFKPRMGPDGHPDLQGLWDAPTVPGGQSIEEHRAEYGFGATNSKIIDPHVSPARFRLERLRGRCRCEGAEVSRLP